MMPSKSDVEHWQINATVYKDRVEEKHYITDPARNIRRKKQTKIWKVEQLLGRGGFGEVRLEKNIEDGQVRAVKRIVTAGTNLSSDEYEKELKALLEFSKPTYRDAAVFVNFSGWFKDGSDVFLAMEYLPLGDLEKNVTAHSGRIPEIEARDITEQILLGLEIMHAELFAHRDLKPQNVLVVHGPPQWWIKLADFGLSKRLTDTTAYRTRSGTQAYMAPEMFQYLDTDTDTGDEYTNAVDLWAVGCIIYRLVTGTVPFAPGKSLLKYCEDKSLFPYDPLLDRGIKSLCCKFIRELLATHPKERASAPQALKHTWITTGSDTRKRPENLPQPNLETSRLADLSTSAMAYNTSTHGGLNSYHLPSLLHAQSSYPESCPSARSASDANLSADFNHLIVRRKPLATSSAEPTIKQLSTNVEAISLAVKSDILANLSSTIESPVTVQPVSNSTRLSLDNKTAAFSPDRKLVTSKSQDKAARTLLGRILPVFKALKTLKGHTDWVQSVAFSPDGKVVASASSDRTVRLWDIATGTTLQTLKGHIDWVRCIAFLPDGKLVISASYDRTVRLWDIATGATLRTFIGHTGWVRSIALSPDSTIVASASSDHTVRLWDIATGTTLQTLTGHTDWVQSVAFSPDGKVVASVSYCIVRFWDIATGATVQTLKGHTGWVQSIAFSPDGTIVASASSDYTVRLWDIATGAALQILKGHRGCVQSVVFSPDGTIVASASADHTVRLWDITTGTTLRTLKGHAGWVQSVAFSPDGKIVASASDYIVQLCDI